MRRYICIYIAAWRFFLFMFASMRPFTHNNPTSFSIFLFTVILIQSLETRMSTKDSLVIPLEREAVHLNASPEASPRSPSNYLPLIPHLSYFFFWYVCLIQLFPMPFECFFLTQVSIIKLCLFSFHGCFSFLFFELMLSSC